MKLENILTPSDMTELRKLVSKAHQEGASTVRLFIESQSIVVVGIVSSGQLLTWFVSIAHSLPEAMLVESVVVAGIALAGLAAHEMSTSAGQIALQAIQRAAAIH